MRVLLIALDYPPVASPQALRWYYLTRELVALGHDVCVLSGDPLPPRGALGVPAGLRVVRTWPLLARLARALRRAPATAPAAPLPMDGMQAGARSEPEELNWKGRLYYAIVDPLRRVLRTINAIAAVPDANARWTRCTRGVLMRTMDAFDPDVVVSSHEPEATLRLGLLAQRAGRRWVVDLGDPVLAPYTEPARRADAAQLEREVYRAADALVVTSQATADLLAARHGPSRRVEVISQGWDDRDAPEVPAAVRRLFDPSRLEIVYTGSFYAFRSPDALVEAVLALPDARLTVAAISVPDSVATAAARHPERIRLLGFQPHALVLGLQRCADVLVNLANALPDQVPGKLYEYIGAGRPILHVRAGLDDDSGARLVEATGAGRTCENTAADIRDALLDLRPLCHDWRAPAVDEYGWTRLGLRLDHLLHSVARRHARATHAEPVSTRTTTQ